MASNPSVVKRIHWFLHRLLTSPISRWTGFEVHDGDRGSDQVRYRNGVIYSNSYSIGYTFKIRFQSKPKVQITRLHTKIQYMSPERGLIPSLPNVSNVCIFIADALRWDHLPEDIDERGLTVKTVAASLTTHTSIPSMLTGLDPKRHGVSSWEHRLPMVPNLLEQPGYDCGFYHPGPESVLNDGTFAVLRRSERREITDLSTPWINVERHHGGHAPFPAVEWWEDSWSDFTDEFSGNAEKHQDWYRRAVESTAEDFQKRIDAIEARGDLEDTLIIFCSDHGEYLGENGLVGHSTPIRPDGAYVPTVFIHPEIEEDTVEGIMRHIDLYPTILNALNEQPPENMDGVDLTKASPDVGYCYANTSVSVGPFDVTIYEAGSVWGLDGGLVRNHRSIPLRIASVVGLLARNGWKSKNLRSKFPSNLSGIKDYLYKENEYGSPPINRKAAYTILKNKRGKEPVSDAEYDSLTEEQRKQLQDLGYL